MNKLYIVTKDSELVGVYTTHQKAEQALIMDTIKEEMKLQDYSFEFDIEFFTYIDSKSGSPFFWEIREITPDERV